MAYKQLMKTKVLGSVVRHVMTLAAGVLVGLGVDPELADQFIGAGTEILIGAVLFSGAQAWSVAEKRD
jgi:hypothetical protein